MSAENSVSYQVRSHTQIYFGAALRIALKRRLLEIAQLSPESEVAV